MAQEAIEGAVSVPGGVTWRVRVVMGHGLSVLALTQSLILKAWFNYHRNTASLYPEEMKEHFCSQDDVQFRKAIIYCETYSRFQLLSVELFRM